MIDYNRFIGVRKLTVSLCRNLELEDFVIQANEEASPVKWHLAHTTWFFETFLLKKYLNSYKEFDKNFNFLFNSYYNSVGQRIGRNQRGWMSRPTVKAIFDYREYVNAAMEVLMSKMMNAELEILIELGIQHEQQHQELLLTDLKYNLFQNPLFPEIMDIGEYGLQGPGEWIRINEAVYSIGHSGKGFSFDNEHGQHKVYLEEFQIFSQLVSNGEFLEFVLSGAYNDPLLWHSDGWAWLQQMKITHPLYWIKSGDGYQYYTLNGVQPLDLNAPVAHISYFEAAAFASWSGCRLPTEFEWEACADGFSWVQRWEWTNSAYLPYPRFQKAKGAIGEYNGKFMVNQMVLRGSSVATPKDHSRKTYRNFFVPESRWQFSGIRLAR